MTKILKENHPNPERTTYHVNKKINDDLVININNIATLSVYKDELYDISYSIVKDLLELEGIEEVSVDKYYITVAKAKLFNWEDLDEKIQKIILNILENPEKIKQKCLMTTQLNEHVNIEWECSECKAINKCTIEQADGFYQSCKDCGEKHDIKINLEVLVKTVKK